MLLIVSSCNSFKKGNKRFAVGEYDVAIDHYKKALKSGKSPAQANFMIAESYRLSNRLFKAAPYYQAALDAGLKDESATFYYGFALKANEQYQESENQLKKYLQSAENLEYISRAETELKNLKILGEIFSKKNFFDVRNLETVNSKEAEYAPIVNNNEFYFTSSRGGGKIYKTTGTPFTSIFKAPINEPVRASNIDFSAAQPLGDDINTDNVNEGSLTFTRDGTTMVFARGNSGRKKGTKEVNLYISRYRNKKWSEPAMMTINDPNAWDSTPAFSADGRTLYFASNREGGFGGIDLYSANLDANGRWVNVKNMGNEINTAGDELFPYVSADGKLYFSSNGHPGLGLLDIFVASRKEGKILIENLGTPVNSSADDFGISYFSPMQGFFSSNRDTGMGDDDIYAFVNNDPDLKIVNYLLTGVTVTTNDEGVEEKLANVKVTLMDTEGNVIQETGSDLDGKFQFRVEGEMNYELLGEQKGYFTTRNDFTTVGKSIPQEDLTKPVTNITFETKLNLDKIVLNKTIVLENIYYDLNKADIRADAAAELDKLVGILKDNPQIKIELGSHTDSRADDNYNIELSQRRAEAAVNYMVSEGIEKNRIRARGYGETQLVNECVNDVTCTEEQHQQNRRTEFKVYEYNPETQKMEEIGN